MKRVERLARIWAEIIAIPGYWLPATAMAFIAMAMVAPTLLGYSLLIGFGAMAGGIPLHCAVAWREEWSHSKKGFYQLGVIGSLIFLGPTIAFGYIGMPFISRLACLFSMALVLIGLTLSLLYYRYDRRQELVRQEQMDLERRQAIVRMRRRGGQIPRPPDPWQAQLRAKNERRMTSFGNHRRY